MMWSCLRHLRLSLVFKCNAQALALRILLCATAFPLLCPSFILSSCKHSITSLNVTQPHSISLKCVFSLICRWLQLNRADPITHGPLKRHRLTPNLNLR